MNTHGRLLAMPLLAIALVIAPQLCLIAFAQDQENKDQPKESSAKTNSDNSDSGDSATNNSQSDPNQAQPSPQTNSNSAKTAAPSNDQPSDSTNNTNNDRQGRDNAGDSNTANNVNGDRNSENRSVLTNQTQDANRENRAGSDHNADNRNNSAHSRDRDFHKDFKFGKAAARGLTIASVVQDSIFYRSGLRDGDVIVSYNGRPIRSQDDFTRYVVYQSGQRVPVVVFRDGREQTIDVVYQDNSAQAHGNGSGLFGAEFDPQADAAVIVRIDQGSPADRAGLKRDDVVVAMNGERINSGRDAAQMVSGFNPGEQFDVEFSRVGRTHVVLSDAPVARKAVSDTRSYNSDDRGPAVAVGVNAEATRKSDAERDRNAQERREDRRENKGILPRLRN